MINMDLAHSLADAAIATSSSSLITSQDNHGRISPKAHLITPVSVVDGTTSLVSPSHSSESTPRTDETAIRHTSNLPTSSHMFHPNSPPPPPPPRKDTLPSISTQATTISTASAETNNISYSAEPSPSLHQSIFSFQDGSEASNTRRTSRRRTGPLSQQSRERAALIRKLGACHDCRRRRVACHPSHHDMTWEDLLSRFHRSHSPNTGEINPTMAVGVANPLSPISSLDAIQPNYVLDEQGMDIDPTPTTLNQPSRYPQSDARIRTPLPSGPRLEKSLSLPGVESLKDELQTIVPKLSSASKHGRYNAVQVLLLFWGDDDDIAIVQETVQELAQVFDKIYHYTPEIQAIPAGCDESGTSWRWLSRQLNNFAEDRDHRDVLKIVYYAGHTYLDGNREMVLASSSSSSRAKESASICRWSGLQQILEETSADTLIIMDAAYYPTCKIVRQKGVLEILAASISEGHFASLARCSFTRALAEQLRIRAARNTPLSAVELHAHLLSKYPQLVHDNHPENVIVTSFPTPLHAMMSGNPRMPSIFLSPLHHGSPSRNNNFSYENSPQLHVTLKLTDDNTNVESWKQWFRLMPEGIKEVKIDGPFRPTL